MNNTEKQFSLLKSLSDKASGVKSTAPIKIGDIVELADYFLTADESAREKIICHVKGKTGLLLIGYTGELASLSIDSRDEVWLIRALVMHIIDGFKYDERENLRRLALISYSADKIKVDFPSLVTSLFALMPKDVRDKFTKFLERPKELNSLKCFGMQEVIVNGKTRFKATGF